ncbi:hypothetical protein [Peribacillus loiseleuriae]|uniref:Uncharacterized protein n=1 Tax=Peribacillus loiseleuriae TaxID=1679170 RepID=A0A0K9GZ43_9BACI|nr:hypothetical protein [Peribacillus loiseleuriae]KMY51870.1 hypothetical protein AC625_22000 [Peribacillus loiseleuriae]
MEQHGRASDHDPVLIQTDLKGKKESVPEIYTIAGSKTKKFEVGTEDSFVIVEADAIVKDGI